MKTMKGGAMTSKTKRRKKQEHMLEILVMTTFIAISLTLVLAVSYMYVHFSTQKNQLLVETLSKELTDLQKEVNETELKQVEYKKQIDQLQAQLSKYEEVVIPESMAS